MDNSLIKKVRDQVIAASRNKGNRFSIDAWENHISIVEDLAAKLAKVYHADAEIVILAALLHDIASLKAQKYVKEHHIHSQRFAAEILEQLDYPAERIGKVQHCIYYHRGLVKIPDDNIEARIVASADAMSHIIHFLSILRLAVFSYKMPLEKTVPWSLKKIRKSWKKISLPLGRRMVGRQYKAIFVVCEYAVKNKKRLE